MSNTLIQIKRSLATAVPPNGSLAVGEQAYSYSSNTLFIGAPDGIGVIAVGGKYYLDTITAAFDHANAAFLAANTGLGIGAAFAAANAAFAAANGAFDSANAGQATANASFSAANGAFASANAGQATANASFARANLAHAHANAAFATANAAFASANAGQATANASFATANAAYNEANTKLSTSGGTITGNLAIVGSLSVAGNTYIIDGQNLRVSDPLIYLAGNNYVSDIVDIGFIANYVNATGQNVHTGLYREHEDKEYYLFQGYDKEPANNHIGAFSNNMTLAILNADIRTSNLILGGANAILTIGASFNHANLAFASANAGQASANAGQATANASFARANLAHAHANAAFATSNASYAFANSAHAIANLAFTHANNAYATANTARTETAASFVTANQAFAKANSASAQAANANFLTSGTIDSARLSGSYNGITGLGTITVGTWEANEIAVGYGGTGQTTFTTNGVLFGNGGGALNVTAAGTEGQVLQASSAGVPSFGHLDGGSF